MVKQVSFNDLGSVDFIPQVIVRRPVTYFSDRLGFKFEQATDDFDDYESAFFMFDDRLPFALVHYKGNPEDTTTIYFGREVKREEVVAVALSILREFDLLATSLIWISPN
jgi:hypothetical protein